MIKIRKGKDIIFRWAILTNGEALALSGRDLTLEIITPYGRRMNMEYETDGNALVFKFRGTKQTMLGVHGITLWENKGKEGQTAVDISNAFKLVRTTEEESDMNNTGGTTGDNTHVTSTEYAVYVGLSASQITTITGGFTVRDIPKGEYDLEDEYPNL